MATPRADQLPAATEQVVIVTGGGAGIGRSTSLRFAREGWRVMIGSRSVQECEAVCQEIREAGGEALSVPGDVARRSDCEQWAKAALSAWGRIDALVANAGARVYASVQDATEDDWRTIVDVNLRGVANSCASVLPSMVRQHTGSIVVVSSTHALVGRSEMPLYDATKAGALSLVRSLAIAHGKDGIRVNAVCPGYTITDFHERNAAKRGASSKQLRKDARNYGLLGRAAEPDEIAAAIYFLASAEASNITAQSLMVDGGVSAKSG